MKVFEGLAAKGTYSDTPDKLKLKRTGKVVRVYKAGTGEDDKTLSSSKSSGSSSAHVHATYTYTSIYGQILTKNTAFARMLAAAYSIQTGRLTLFIPGLGWYILVLALTGTGEAAKSNSGGGGVGLVHQLPSGLFRMTRH